MAIRCIALDMDRTTLNREGKLSEENRQALVYAIERGAEIVIASGRAFSALPQDVSSIPGVNYAITSNGAAIYHIPSEKCLHKYAMTAESVQKILPIIAEEDIAYEVFVDGKAYALSAYVEDPVRFGMEKSVVPYVKSTRHPVEDLPAFIAAHITELDSMDLIVRDMETKQRLWSQLEQNVPDIYITSSSPWLVEISYKNSGKHMGLRFLRQLLQLRPEEMAAFGDNDNDAEMLSEVGVGIAMGNSTERCLEAADKVTLDYCEHGVAWGIYHLLSFEDQVE